MVKAQSPIEIISSILHYFSKLDMVKSQWSNLQNWCICVQSLHKTSKFLDQLCFPFTVPQVDSHFSKNAKSSTVSSKLVAIRIDSANLILRAKPPKLILLVYLLCGMFFFSAYYGWVLLTIESLFTKYTDKKDPMVRNLLRFLKFH